MGLLTKEKQGETDLQEVHMRAPVSYCFWNILCGRWTLWGFKGKLFRHGAKVYMEGGLFYVYMEKQFQNERCSTLSIQILLNK